MNADSASPMGLFERYLSLWVALCILAGVALGVALPQLFAVIASIEFASVNLVVAVLIWVMIYPMMVIFVAIGVTVYLVTYLIPRLEIYLEARRIKVSIDGFAEREADVAAMIDIADLLADRCPAGA